MAQVQTYMASYKSLGRQHNLDSLNCNYWDFFPAAKKKVDCVPTKVGLDGENSHISLDWPYLSRVIRISGIGAPVGLRCSSKERRSKKRDVERTTSSAQSGHSTKLAMSCGINGVSVRQAHVWSAPTRPSIR